MTMIFKLRVEIVMIKASVQMRLMTFNLAALIYGLLITGRKVAGH